MNFKPMNKNILVERMEEEKKTATGIIIPDSATEKPSIATVKAVSDKIKNISVGDKIIFSKYGGTEVTLEGKEYLILEANGVLGILG